MYEEELALNNLQLLICHKTKPNEKIFSKFDWCSLFIFSFVCFVYLISGKGVVLFIKTITEN